MPFLNAVIRARGTQAVVRAARRWPATKDPARFATAELFGPRGRVQRHQVAGGRVILRHRTRDVEIFDEIFVGAPSYEPPPAVAAALHDRPPKTVLDLGGNVGLFAVYALARWPSATITSVEPDPANLPLLARCVEANAAAERWTVIAACAASRPGVVAFSGGRFANSTIALDGDAVTDHVVAVDALDLLADADFVKIDIEGGEWDLLLDPRFADHAPAVVVMEWHQRGCPTDDGYTAACDVFRQAGYQVEGEVSLGDKNGLIWAWRSDRSP
jgi:FkbM family methyltransferase